jgi:hypothetical protein
MKAIMTRYLSQTNTKPARIKATDCTHNSVTISRHDFESYDDAHEAAALQLCRKMKWDRGGIKLIGGGLGGDDQVWCFVPASVLTDIETVLDEFWVNQKTRDETTEKDQRVTAAMFRLNTWVGGGEMGP